MLRRFLHDNWRMQEAGREDCSPFAPAYSGFVPGSDDWAKPAGVRRERKSVSDREAAKAAPEHWDMKACQPSGERKPGLEPKEASACSGSMILKVPPLSSVWLEKVELPSLDIFHEYVSYELREN